MKVPRPFQWLFFWPMHLLASVTASPPHAPHTAVITNWLPPLDILLMLSPASLAPADCFPCTFITHAICHAVRTQSFPSTTTRSIDAEELSRDRHHTSGGTIQLVQEEARVPCNLVDAVAFPTMPSTAMAAVALAVAVQALAVVLFAAPRTSILVPTPALPSVTPKKTNPHHAFIFNLFSFSIRTA